MKNKYIIATSALISLILFNAQDVYAENHTEQIEIEPIVTEVQNSQSQLLERDDKEQEIHNIDSETSSTDEQLTKTTSNETDNISQPNLEIPQTETINTDESIDTTSTGNSSEEDSESKSQRHSLTVEPPIVKSEEDYIVEYQNAYYVSDLWRISQEFKASYPNSQELSMLINDAALSNIAEGLRNHRTGNYSVAAIYYNRVLSEPLVSTENQDLVKNYLFFAKNQKQVKTADQYYIEYKEAYYVSDLWRISQEFKTAYPNDSRLSMVINDATSKNITEGQRAHRKGNFDLASIYYNRAINENFVNPQFKNQATNLLDLANKQIIFRTADEFYEEYREVYYVSNKWVKAQEFKAAYPTDSRISAVINDAANENLKEGQRAHRSGNFELAIIYYNRVLSESLINTSIKNQVTHLRNLADAKILFKSVDVYVKEYEEMFYVSQKWELAQEFVATYPSNQRALDTLNDAAKENIQEGQRAHRRQDYELALIYYNRVLNEYLVADYIHDIANVFASQAINKTPLKLADDYVKEYNKAFYVSDLWQIAQEFKAVYPNDYRVIEVLNDAALQNIKEGQRAHSQKNYDRALSYYNRVVEEEHIDATTVTRTRKYIEYAKNKTPIKSVASFNQEFKQAYFVSEKWAIAKEFRTLYPENKDAIEAMKEAANGNLNEGRTAQRKGDLARARTYYNRILNEELVDEQNRYLASVFLNQTSAQHTPVIYVDVGHGGNDPGATHFGVQEKVLNLNVSNDLKRELERRGYIVIMSRETDRYIDLSDRPFEANDLNVDAFISVHHNSMGGSGIAKGLETFVFHRVESGFGQETNHNNFNLHEPRISESLLLANQIHSHLVRSTGLYNRGVKGNNYNVLRNSYAPAALVELGFMDNYTELSIINNRNYQRRAAEAMAIGIDNYFKGINK